MGAIVYTIGHSTHPKLKFLELLARHGVTAIADVRSRPYSRMNPQFNRESLCNDLKDARMAYVFLGSELGARAEDRSCYVDGKVQYDLLARTPLFQDGLRRLEQGIDTYRIALMCAEKDPLRCHRAILVCRHLAARGITSLHIREEGELESHDDAIARLLDELGFAEQQLFRSRDDAIDEAYFLRGQQLAYSDTQPSFVKSVNRLVR